MIKAVLFDLDGVIVDTAKYHFMAWKKLADSLKIKFTVEDNERLKGVSRMESLEIILELSGIVISDTEKIRLAEMKNSMYVELIRKLSKKDVLPGIVTILLETAPLRLKKALASSSKNAGFILKKIGLEKSFDAIIDGNQINKTKPDPEIFLKAAEALRTEPKDCLVVEDAEAGIRAAKMAGMHTLGIGNSNVLKEADLVIPGFANQSFNKILSKFNLEREMS